MDTLTNKKGDKTGHKGRQKGDKADTVTDKKGDKTQNKTDTVTNKKGDILPRTEHLCSQGKQKETEGRQGGHSDQQEGKQGRQAGGGHSETALSPNSNLFGEVQKAPGRQMNRNAGKAGCQQCRHRTWKTKVNTSHGRQMNRNSAWPAEKGGYQQRRHRTWETEVGVDLNSFIRDPSLSPKRCILAKCSPSCVLSFAEVRCIYVCHVCCVLFTSMASSLLANTK